MAGHFKRGELGGSEEIVALLLPPVNSLEPRVLPGPGAWPEAHYDIEQISDMRNISADIRISGSYALVVRQGK